MKAVAYIRTSSAANVGPDKDSGERQRLAIAAYAKRESIAIADDNWFADEDVKGADPIEERPGFAALLERIEANGVRLVIVEDASRFARELLIQELGIMLLIAREVRVVTAGGLDLTDTSDPFKVMIRQVMGAFAQLEKARLVAKLRGARERKKIKTGKCGGRKSYLEQENGPALILAAAELNDGVRTLRAIAAELAARGLTTSMGRPYAPAAVSKILNNGGAEKKRIKETHAKHKQTSRHRRIRAGIAV